jgi:hypothetical protein
MISGGCFCGAVRFRITGPAIDAGACHCATCRGVSSAPSLPFVTFNRVDFAIAQGEPVTFESSPRIERTFCGRCGAPLTYFNKDAQNTIDVMTCSLDNAEEFPPKRHVWMKHKLSWDVPGDGLPQYSRNTT